MELGKSFWRVVRFDSLVKGLFGYSLEIFYFSFFVLFLRTFSSGFLNDVFIVIKLVNSYAYICICIYSM